MPLPSETDRLISGNVAVQTLGERDAYNAVFALSGSEAPATSSDGSASATLAEDVYSYQPIVTRIPTRHVPNASGHGRYSGFWSVFENTRAFKLHCVFQVLQLFILWQLSCNRGMFVMLSVHHEVTHHQALEFDTKSNLHFYFKI